MGFSRVRKSKGIRPAQSHLLTAIKKNKNGTIVKYQVEGLGWLSKEKAIELTTAGQVDAVVAISRSGSTYLRTRPDKTSANNLESLG